MKWFDSYFHPALMLNVSVTRRPVPNVVTVARVTSCLALPVEGAWTEYISIRVSQSSRIFFTTSYRTTTVVCGHPTVRNTTRNVPQTMDRAMSHHNQVKRKNANFTILRSFPIHFLESFEVQKVRHININKCLFLLPSFRMSINTVLDGIPVLSVYNTR